MKISFIKKIQNLFRNPKDFNEIGLSYFKSGFYDSAISNFTKAIQKNKKYYESFVWRGKSYLNVKNFELAHKDFTKIIDSNHKFIGFNPFYYRGICEMNMNNFIAARNDFDSALNFDSYQNRFEICLNRGIVNYELNNYRDSIKDLDMAIALGSNNYHKKYEYDKISFGNAFYCRASAKEEIEDFEGAILDYTQSINFNSEDLIAYSDRSELYMKIGKSDLALIDLLKVKELENNSKRNNT